MGCTLRELQGQQFPFRPVNVRFVPGGEEEPLSGPFPGKVPGGALAWKGRPGLCARCAAHVGRRIAFPQGYKGTGQGQGH